MHVFYSLLYVIYSLKRIIKYYLLPKLYTLLLLVAAYILFVLLLKIIRGRLI